VEYKSLLLEKADIISARVIQSADSVCELLMPQPIALKIIAKVVLLELSTNCGDLVFSS
jgi:hypothetical protein